ncbi:MAG: type II toxin-antitoxin system HicB family antitoxin [Gemmatimonadetes bacterium]|nr:type II toxin-antitoxin system HicB family antitoxin [Gemmatimonadota bacterium]
MVEQRGYTGTFEYDPELEPLAGHAIDLQDEIYFEGESVTELKSSMHRAVDHYLEVCDERGDTPDKPFSGQLRLRMDPQLHRSLAIAASTAGKNLNTWIVEALEGAAH